jgi:hypothetical protein
MPDHDPPKIAAIRRKTTDMADTQRPAMAEAKLAAAACCVNPASTAPASTASNTQPSRVGFLCCRAIAPPWHEHAPARFINPTRALAGAISS